MWYNLFVSFGQLTLAFMKTKPKKKR